MFLNLHHLGVWHGELPHLRKTHLIVAHLSWAYVGNCTEVVTTNGSQLEGFAQTPDVSEWSGNDASVTNANH